MVESDIILLVGHHYGVGQLIDSKGKSKMSSKFGDFLSIDQVEVAPYKASDVKTNVRIEFKDMAVSEVALYYSKCRIFWITLFVYPGVCLPPTLNRLIWPFLTPLLSRIRMFIFTNRYLEANRAA